MKCFYWTKALQTGLRWCRGIVSKTVMHDSRRLWEQHVTCFMSCTSGSWKDLKWWFHIDVMGQTQSQLKNITPCKYNHVLCGWSVNIQTKVTVVVSHSWWRIWCCILLLCWWAWCHTSWPTVSTARRSSRLNNLCKSVLRWRIRVNNRYIPKYKFSFEWKKFLSAPDAFLLGFCAMFECVSKERTEML